MNRLKITAPAPLLDDLENMLSDDADSNLVAGPDTRNITGIEVIAVIANLSTIGLTILTAWELKHRSNDIKVERTPDLSEDTKKTRDMDSSSDD